MPVIVCSAQSGSPRVGAALVVGALAIAGAAAAAAPPLRQSFDVQVPTPAFAARIDGATRLVYELHLTNFAAAPLRVVRIEARDAERGVATDDLRGAALAGAFGARDGTACDDGGCTVAPGARAIVYLWSASADGRVPATLRHRIAFTAAGDAAVATIDGGAARVEADARPALGPPLAGGPWVAVYGPEMARGHRRVVYAIDGRARIPGRFAIDWMRVDAQGRLAHGDANRVANWYGYGADVLAVADAVVAATRDDVAEAVAVDRASSPPIGDAAGNYVVLDLGDGRFAFYEHLQPGSVRVRAGERVRRGQTLARLGFTGQSTGPHLHFHVADAAAPLAAEGLPYTLASFRLLGRYASIEAFGRGEAWTPARARDAVERSGELPAANAVVEFPAAADAR